jgi:hypothetical protein
MRAVSRGFVNPVEPGGIWRKFLGQSAYLAWKHKRENSMLIKPWPSHRLKEGARRDPRPRVKARLLEVQSRLGLKGGPSEIA